jgi:Spy/CpxP family protein refolding chaperone
MIISALRSTAISLALLLVTFVGGLLAGAAFERTVRGSSPVESERESRERTPSRDSNDHGDRPSRFMERIGLTEEQHVRIDSIVRHGRAQTQAFWDNEGKRLREIVEETRSAVRGVLTPEQRERYDELRARRGDGRHGGPQGHDERPRS